LQGPRHPTLPIHGEGRVGAHNGLGLGLAQQSMAVAAPPARFAGHLPMNGEARLD